MVAVHVGDVDTDMQAGFEATSSEPAAVAKSASTPSRRDGSEAAVDELTRGVKSALHDDLNLIYPALERSSPPNPAGAPR